MTKLAYTVRDAAEAASTSRTTVYEEMKAGRLRAVKINGSTVILAEDLKKWLDALPPYAPQNGDA
jgi:excisionase family DNA binding protein